MKNIVIAILIALGGFVAACEPLPEEAPPIEVKQQAVLTGCSGGAVPAGRCRLYSAVFKGGLCAELTAFTGEGIPVLSDVFWPGTGVVMGWSGDDVESWACAVQSGSNKVQTVGFYDLPNYLHSSLPGSKFEDFHCSGSPGLGQSYMTMTPRSFRFKNWFSTTCSWKPF